MKKLWFIYVIAALGFVFGAANIFASDRGESASASALRGLETVNVDVRSIDENVRPEVKAQGLSEEQLEVMMINKLEPVGIKAFSGYEAGKSAQQAVLYLKLYILSPELTQKTIRTIDNEKVPRGKAENRYLYSAILELRQPVVLERDSSITLSTPTWSTESTGFRRVKGINTNVSGMLDAFVQAYNAANIKPK